MADRHIYIPFKIYKIQTYKFNKRHKNKQQLSTNYTRSTK